MRVGLVVLDTLRLGTFRDEMAQISEYADHRFSNFYSSSRWTVPAHASLFTGLYPTEVGSHAGNRHYTSNSETLAERFDADDYETVALSNNVHIDSFFGFDRGFETLHRGPNLEGRPDEETGEFDWDELFSTIGDGPFRYLRALRRIVSSDAPTVPTLRTGLEFLRSGTAMDHTGGIDWAHDAAENHLTDPPEDLFFFANLMPVHFPYEPPEEYSPVEPLDEQPFHLSLRDEPVTDEEHRRHWENYTGAARYLDDELPKLIDGVDWDCLFIISDHGELFGEHDGLRGHEYGIHEELVHVPAVALGSEVPEGTTDELTSILDVHRTLLEIAGIDVPEHARGYNLFEDEIPDDRAVYAESTGVGQYSPDAKGVLANIPAEWDQEHYMLRTDDAMLIVDGDGTRVIDPESGDERPEREDELLDRVERIRADRRDFSGESTDDDEDVPEDIQDRLEHLGYK